MRVFWVLLILFITNSSWDFEQEENIVVVEFTGSGCEWIVRFPGEDNVFGKTSHELVLEQNIRGIDPEDPYGLDDIVLVSSSRDILLPNTGSFVFKVTSLDNKHLLDIEELKVQINAVPGLTITRVFDGGILDGVETIHISCKEDCEAKCNNMKTSLKLVSIIEFNKMLDEIKGG